MHLEPQELAACIGLVSTYTAPEPIGEASFRYFAQAVGDRNPVYLDHAAATAAGHATVIAPPTLVCETNQLTDRRPDANGYVGHRWPIIPADATWIRGGNDYRFGRPVQPHDRITVEWQLVRAENRTTRDGRDVVMLVSEGTYTDQRGDLLAWNRETLFLADPPEA